MEDFNILMYGGGGGGEAGKRNLSCTMSAISSSATAITVKSLI